MIPIEIAGNFICFFKPRNIEVIDCSILYENLEENTYYNFDDLGVSHYDIDGNGVINYYDLLLKKSDGSASDEEIASLEEAVNSTRIPNSAEFIYNHYYSNDGMVDADDYNEGT